jgi:hypothetical protein
MSEFNNNNSAMILAVATEADRRYAMRALPTFVGLSADGREIYRESGRPDTERVEREALSPG